MTANVAPEDVRSCHDAGMDGFLGMPIMVQTLAEVLRHPPATAPPGPAPGGDDLLADLCAQIVVEKVREIAAAYLEAMELALPALVAADHARDRELVGSTVHRLKGSARSLGLDGLGDLLETLELEVGAADWPGVDVLVERIGSEHLASRDTLVGRLDLRRVLPAPASGPTPVPSPRGATEHRER